MKIVILGAGISGLTCAVALKKLSTPSTDIVVYERDSSPDYRHQGYALGLDDAHALPVLQSLGLFDTIVQHKDSQKITNFLFENHKGKLLLSSAKISKKKISYRVQRNIIKSTLAEALGDIPIYYNHQAIHIDNQATKPLVTFANGKTDSADFVIACDGASSKIRQQIIGDEKCFLNLASVSGISKTALKPSCLNGGYYMGLADDGSSVFIYHQPEGIYYSYNFKTDDASYLSELSQHALLQFIIDKTPKWSKLVRDIIQSTDVKTIGLRHYFDRQPLKKMRYGNLWIIGDAAHTMSPFRGLGANLAMVDAYQLAYVLCNLTANEKQNEKAMRALEKKRIKQGKNATLQSRHGAKTLHTANKWALALRAAKFGVYRALLYLA